MAVFHQPIHSWPRETHEAFAASLMLILPSPMMHIDAQRGDITPTIIENARIGAYAPRRVGMYESPLAFESPHYAGHLKAEIRALMRAYYPEANLPEE